jgi:alcohol dehydrogenase
MRGLVLEGPRAIAHRTDLPEPHLLAGTDALVRVRRAGLCGSDLHPYEGREPARPGVVPGHEVVGEVLAVGDAVARVAVGDRVLVPFTTSCGRCEPCGRALSARCVQGELFGWGDPEQPTRPPLHGGQAEALRVPLADGTLVGVPEALPDVEALLLTDNLPTGWYAAERALSDGGGALAVVGLGAVGLCAVVAARALGAGAVLAVDPVATRRAQAERLGAVASTPEDAAAALERLAGGRVLGVVEAAGTAAAQRLALSLLRPGGALSVIAVQTAGSFPFTPIEAYDANLTIHLGRAPVRSVLDRVLPALAAGRLRIPADVIVTHPDLPLEMGPEAYARFSAREPGLTKVAFAP